MGDFLRDVGDVTSVAELPSLEMVHSTYYICRNSTGTFPELMLSAGYGQFFQTQAAVERQIELHPQISLEDGNNAEILNLRCSIIIDPLAPVLIRIWKEYIVLPRAREKNH